MKCPNCNADVYGRFCEYCHSEVKTEKEAIFEKVQPDKKYCKHCGSSIPKEAVICVHCGCQVESIATPQPSIIINNANNNVQQQPVAVGRKKNKWVAFVLCLFLGYFGAHKFYEGRIVFGILYLFTYGLFGVGWIIDLILILCKPNPYYV